MEYSRKILLLASVAAFFLILLLVASQERNMSSQSKNGDENVTSNQSVSNYTVLVSKEVCEGCHISGKSFIPQALSVKPHLNGGMYCLMCHKISHEVHPMNQNVTCEKCHGTNPTKPVFINGSITCNNCHGYPDPLTPSYGNLISIHRPRGISCNNCHNDECTKCHIEIGGNERWEKRQAHFKALSKNP
jgi:hypothetical protein